MGYLFKVVLPVLVIACLFSYMLVRIEAANKKEREPAIYIDAERAWRIG